MQADQLFQPVDLRFKHFAIVVPAYDLPPVPGMSAGIFPASRAGKPARRSWHYSAGRRPPRARPVLSGNEVPEFGPSALDGRCISRG